MSRLTITNRTLPLLIGLGIAAGCGDSDEDRARKVVQQFQDAVSDGRADRACSLMTTAGRRELVTSVANDPAIRPKGPVRTCSQAIPGIAGGERTKATSTETLGEDRVSVTIEVPCSDDPDSGGSVEAIREDGTWRVGPAY